MRTIVGYFNHCKKIRLRMDTKHIITAVALTLGFLSLEAKDITTSLDERVAIKKLTEYWQEKDETRVKSTLIDFVNKYPDSSYVNQLYAMLGDLYFSEKNYPDALVAYQKIQDKEFQRKSSFHHLMTLYELELFQEFIRSADSFLEDPHAKQKEIETISFALAESCQHQGQLATGDTRKELFKKAITHYEGLKRTAFESSILDPLAHLYAALEDYPKAANTYLKWAEKDEKNREALLFHAANFQIHYDKKNALKTLDRIFKMKGSLAVKAGYNMIVILFQMERYSDVVMISNYVGHTLPEDKICAVQYYVGKSLFYEKDFESASAVLEEALTIQGHEEFQEGILVTLISCAKETNDLSLCDRMIKLLPPSENLNAALLIHSQLCRNHKEWTVAREDIEKLLVEYPEHKEKEALLYDVATLLMQEGKSEESYHCFDSFAKEYPHSAYRAEALSHSLHLKLQATKNLAGKEKKQAQEILAAALKSDLNEKELFSQEEQKHMRFLLAQTSFNLNRIQETTSILNDYIKDFSQDPSCKDAYLLLCICYQGKDDSQYILCAEKALELDPQIQNHSQLHLGLFNSYLKLCETASPQEKKEWLAKASDHLFKVSDGSITQNNQRFLAGYYLQQEKNPERAISVLEKLLKVNGEKPLLAPHVESEALRLALLYREQGRHLDSIVLLNALIQEQKNNPLLEWKYNRKAQFELGKSYDLSGNPERAIEIYQELISSSSHVASYFGSAAKLELSKLQFSTVAADNADAAGQACDRLKEIEVARQLYSEPLHTEAGLHYVHIKTQLSEEPIRQEKKYNLLTQVKNGLASFHDPKIELFPEKRELINQYLSYIDIELSQIQGEPSKKTKERLQELLLSVSNEILKERIVKNLEELDHNL